MTGCPKTVAALLCALVLSALLWGCGGEETEPPAPTLPVSLKGYELYSWFGGPDWHYALLVGTNRVKTFEEISSRDVRVEGINALKDALSLLPEGEQVFWSTDRVPGTTLPPSKTVQEVLAFCDQYGIWLEVADSGG